ncbi:hypothetical protein [Priestia megaterium]|uniref:hypothetical protein n=1 Tax=Priestia megaterium TaxID=1404 RepID=UPI000BFB6AF0|nr:hypothetical protein [Priestia megaterium]PGO60630.1 hypothetical protein CN981_08760 [Priestia megaterium]
MKKDKVLFFTDHQLKRMSKRGINKLIINTVVKSGKWRKAKKIRSYEVEYKGVIVILYEQKYQYNVATCKLNRENTIKAQELKEELGINFWEATQRVVKSINFCKDVG